ncbi:DUF4190 domain-containing protein [Streptomyces fumanus]|uniref:DUF4190 domain-containing protein n=1 Tax=Streptomyces fumanus TaxID=67302 RepID=A0A919A7X6_9ACTN|nr:DUF4190 domain-containing protein [Streptomyces fumanus]GHE92280.1 hypothetical protein GCM10018772_14920 [Streptomyces fumanus]
MVSTQNHYAASGTGPGTTAERRNGFGIAALVLGLCAAVLFWTVIGGIVLGALAVVFGILGYRRKKRGLATNGAMALIGAVVGALALIGSSVILAAGVAVFNSDEFKSYSDCVDHANTAAERDQCAKDFQKDTNRD